MAKLALWTTCVCFAQASGVEGNAPNQGSTDVSDHLNSLITASDSGIYRGGKGVLVRTPDFFGGDTTVVPATFWVNDIVAPSQMYPSGNPMCPSSWDGWSSLSQDCSSQDGNPWDFATVAVVIGWEMDQIMTDWDHIQDDDWGWGVFYPFDSNSCDGRCAWSDDYNGYDCPGGWIEGDWMTFSQNPDNMGAGFHTAGNPFTGGGGGGAGCHFDTDRLDQMDATDLNLVQDVQCQCNMIFSDDWEHWVDQWIYKGTQKQGFEWRGWFKDGKAPTWAMDASMCWVSNFRDMIKLQNALYFKANDWNNQRMPESSWGSGNSQDRIYWGWNEIPVMTAAVEEPKNWDSIIVKLPADVCDEYDGGNDIVDCLNKAQKKDLMSQLKSFESAGKLLTGVDQVSQRPGSYILFVREYRSGSGWARYFFCSNWVDANFDRVIRFDTGMCYYDVKKSSSFDVV